MLRPNGLRIVVTLLTPTLQHSVSAAPTVVSNRVAVFWVPCVTEGTCLRLRDTPDTLVKAPGKPVAAFSGSKGPATQANSTVARHDVRVNTTAPSGTIWERQQS